MNIAHGGIPRYIQWILLAWVCECVMNKKHMKVNCCETDSRLQKWICIVCTVQPARFQLAKFEMYSASIYVRPFPYTRPHPYDRIYLKLYRFSGFDLYIFALILSVFRHFRHTLCQANCASYRVVSCRDFHINSKMVIYESNSISHAHTHINTHRTCSQSLSISTVNTYKLDRIGNAEDDQALYSIALRLCVSACNCEENIFFPLLKGIDGISCCSFYLLRSRY